MPLSSDPEQAAIQKGNLLRGPSTDPDAAARSRANLRRGRESHGAYQAKLREPIEAQHQVRLRAEFPNAAATPGGDDLVNSAARRLAMLDLFSAWIQDAGPIFGRSGRAEALVSAPAREARVLLDGHERAIERLMALERVHKATAGVPTLEQIRAEYAAGTRQLPPAGDTDVDGAA